MKWKKAHPDVFNILLQIFEDGRLTDAKGRTVNCKNALFIMTSNLGSNKLLEAKEEMTKESIMALLDPIIKQHFRPEFINRLDDILPFLPLKKEDMHHIVEIQLKHLEKRMAERHIGVTFDESLLKHLSDEGYDSHFGARPLKRLIQQVVINPLSKAILGGEIKADQKLVLKWTDGNLDF